MHLPNDLLISCVLKCLDHLTRCSMWLEDYRGFADYDDYDNANMNMEPSVRPDPSPIVKPDYLLYMKGSILLFIGEEDESYSKAVDDLANKLAFHPAFCGNVQYIVGFAASRDKIGFYAISR